MDSDAAIRAFAALAQSTRLAVVRHLIAVHPRDVAAGEIAKYCRVPHNTMSAHLAALVRARLVRVLRQGRRMAYGADLDGFRALLEFLIRDCGSCRPELAAQLLSTGTCNQTASLTTGNSHRS
jgi:DNA-binding transcriptional ArsR family regulator